MKKYLILFVKDEKLLSEEFEAENEFKARHLCSEKHKTVLEDRTVYPKITRVRKTQEVI